MRRAALLKKKLTRERNERDFGFVFCLFVVLHTYAFLQDTPPSRFLVSLLLELLSFLYRSHRFLSILRVCLLLLTRAYRALEAPYSPSSFSLLANQSLPLPESESLTSLQVDNFS